MNTVIIGIVASDVTTYASNRYITILREYGKTFVLPYIPCNEDLTDMENMGYASSSIYDKSLLIPCIIVLSGHD